MNEAANDRMAGPAAAEPLPPYPWIPPPGRAEPDPARPGSAESGSADSGPGDAGREGSWPEPASASVGLPEALDAALAGTGVAVQDRQFIDRLAMRDKRNAASLVSLLWKARFTGRAEAAMKPQEFEIVIGALRDAARYRESGADSLGCRDCEDVPGGRCAEHSKDYDRAQACTDLAAALTAARAALGKGAAGKATATGTGLPQQRGDEGYVRPVAS